VHQPESAEQCPSVVEPWLAMHAAEWYPVILALLQQTAAELFEYRVP
jgi:hypothetical protein